MDGTNFRQLIDQWYEPLYRFAYSLARNRDDALDLTQQTFARWAEKGHTLRNQDRAKSWLFMVLYREFLRTRRSRQREVSVDAATELDRRHSTLPEAGGSLDADAVLTVLGTLDAPFRAAVSLFYLESHSYKEIAVILDIPIGTVMSRIARGKEQLRQRMAEAPRTAGKIVPMPQAKGNHHG